MIFTLKSKDYNNNNNVNENCYVDDKYNNKIII